MQLIEPSFEIIEQSKGLSGVYKQIELAGRVCYKSENRITEDSAKEFVDRLVKMKHNAMLEHGTVYLKITLPRKVWKSKLVNKYYRNPYSKVINYIDNKDSIYYITTNMRVLIENMWLSDLKYLVEPTIYHAKRVTVKFILSRAIAQEFTRHRVFSFAMESQRFCNYSKNKCNNSITFIKPLWVSEETLSNFTDILEKCSDSYFMFLKDSTVLKPQDARDVLPNATKTELVMTGFLADWGHFFELRTAEAAHPEARRLACPLQEEFIKREYLMNPLKVS